MDYRAGDSVPKVPKDCAEELAAAVDLVDVLHVATFKKAEGFSAKIEPHVFSGVKGSGSALSGD